MTAGGVPARGAFAGRGAGPTKDIYTISDTARPAQIRTGRDAGRQDYRRIIGIYKAQGQKPLGFDHSGEWLQRV